MKGLTRFRVAVAVLAALTLSTGVGSAATSATARANGNGPSPDQLQRLKEKARGPVTVSTESSTNYIGFVRAAEGGDLLPDSTAGSPEGKTQEFMAQYAGLMGLEGDSALVRAAAATDRQGATHVTYRQVYKGVAVFGGTVKAHVDADGSLTSVNGTVVPDIQLNVAPKLSAAAAGQRAIAAVIADPPRDENGAADFLTAADLQVAGSTLYVYRTGLVRGVPGTSQLAYEVEVTNGNDVREVVYVHAHAGKILNRYSAIGHALFRRVFERDTAHQVWMEGDPFPGTLTVDQQNIVNFSGHTYWLFFNAFGRDSWDGAGAEMQTVNNDPRINCPNANWNGITTNYCTGVTGDDTVGHEWAHAYTERTHNLIYQWQSGALNEAYSDIWGEVVDFLNGMGTDSPDTVRTVGNCSSFSRAAPGLFINSPAAIAGECPTGGALFGPALTATGTTGDVVLAQDEANPAGPTTSDGCTAFTNAAAMAGKVALIDRGTCGFVVKVKNAQNAGAIAAIVANVIAGQPPATMAGSDPTITIPSVSTTLDHGNLMKGQLSAGNTVNVTMKDKAGTREPSYRWLSGEDDPAFGGAIRDMWNPRCLSDPGKVTDAEYHCDTSDAGGVHTNSGVPNHGFALLVDGGTYNGQTVAAIGLTKAAHLYWRAQSVYQTRTSDFNDHADALEASCTDLIGVALTGLSTTSTPAPPSGQSFTAADCAAVTAMTAAVELRHDPTAQCNFQPLLKQGPPALCPDGTKPDTLYLEDFKKGLGAWTLTNQGVFAGWPGLNWQHATALPGGRTGSAAFAADPDAGNCDGGAGDISGVMRMESPVITVKAPAGTQSLRLSFQHYVATEFGWDGGNLSISVNGGAYQLVPASAFLFNAYNTTLQTVAAGNTNPLAGQPGFSGTDGGQVHGSWGESQIDLTALGVVPGNQIRLRFAFGMDGCAGVDGWYVDDVKVSACKLKARGRD